MTDRELIEWLFPAKLTMRRKWTIRAIMFTILIVVAWLFNDPMSPLFPGRFQ